MEHSKSAEDFALTSGQENVIDEARGENVVTNRHFNAYDIHKTVLDDMRTDLYLKSLEAIQKLSAIKRICSGESMAAIAQDIAVSQTTLRYWNRSKKQIINQSETIANMLRAILTMENDENDDASTASSTTRRTEY
ncbi:hypothetical protein HN011_010021 [Eciton burchellii]|nr:hypothetical protein HN011_010021 [Eciton burchellii]